MIFVRDPEDDELSDLKHMTRHAVGRVSQRAQMVLLSAQRRTVPELAAIFDLHPASVRFWLRRFDRDGPAGLYDAPRSGRPREMDQANDQRLAVQQALEKLSASDREVLYLFDVAGFKTDEIGDMLGVRGAAIRQRLSRARERFRTAYGSQA